MGLVTRRLRIVRLVPTLDFGGVESRVVLWARCIDQARYETRVCTFWRRGEAARRIEALGVPVDCLEVDPAVRSARASLALHRYLRRIRPDVLHASIGEANWHALINGKLAGVRRVLVEETGIPSFSRLGRAAFGLGYHAADAVVAVSQATADYLRGLALAPAEKVRVVYNCADATFFEAPARALGAPDELSVLAVGRLHPVKNYDGLLRAFRLVVDAFPGARLAIAGEGPSRASLLALCAALGLEAHVTFLGFRPDVRALHSGADLFVLPSHSEGLSVALIEAMASGVAPLASRRGGNPEVVDSLGDEVLLEPADHEGWARAILRVAALTPEARRELGARARAVAERSFSPARYLGALDALYREGRPASPRSPR
jgi:glycosyltransferase involved in cell wall biosynthesis